MKIRELLRKINDVVRPVHVGERGPTIDDVNADAAGTIKGRGALPTGYMSPQQDDRPRS